MTTTDFLPDDEIQRVLSAATADGSVPGIVSVVADRRHRTSLVSGLADVDTGVARSGDERFRIGSITKTFVATLALQLVAEQRLHLETTVEEILPGLLAGVPHGTAITLRHLLGCTSGLFNYTADPAVWTMASPDARSLVALAVHHEPGFAPGTDWAYSNTDYVVAALMIETVTGRALATELHERIIDPLRLAGTSFPIGDDEALPDPHATHYGILDPGAGVQDVTAFPVGWSWAAGNMISTTDDLAVFLDALCRGELLPPDELAAMRTTAPTHDWIPDTRFGLGTITWFSTDGVPLWGMAGSLPGSTTVMFATPQNRHRIAANINADFATGRWSDPFELLLHIADRALRDSGNAHGGRDDQL